VAKAAVACIAGGLAGIHFGLEQLLRAPSDYSAEGV